MMNQYDNREPEYPRVINYEAFNEYRNKLPPLIPITTDIRAEIDSLENLFASTYNKIYENQRKVYTCMEITNELLISLDRKVTQTIEKLETFQNRQSVVEKSLETNFKNLWC